MEYYRLEISNTFNSLPSDANELRCSWPKMFPISVPPTLIECFFRTFSCRAMFFQTFVPTKLCHYLTIQKTVFQTHLSLPPNLRFSHLSHTRESNFCSFFELSTSTCFSRFGEKLFNNLLIEERIMQIDREWHRLCAVNTCSMKENNPRNLLDFK